MAYTRLPVAFDVQDLVDDAVAYLIAKGWDPQTGTVEAWLIEAFSRLIHRLGVAAAQTPDEAARIFGVHTIGFPADLGARATALSTWTIRGTAGHTIQEGTVVAVGAGNLQFRVVSDYVVAPGASVITDVPLEAIEVGARFNGLAAGSATPIVTDAAVLQVLTTTTSSGGADAQTATEYLDAFAADLQLLQRSPLLEWQYGVAARRVDGVFRARAIRGYDASTSTPDQPRHITLVPVDESGNELAADVHDALVAEVTDDGARILNVIVHVVPPTPVPVTVDYAAVPDDDADPSAVSAAGIQALSAFLSKGRWAGGDQSPPVWERSTDPDNHADVIYLDDLRDVLRDVDGLKRVTTLTVNGGTVDVDLSSGGTILGPLPQATVTGTVA